MNLANLVIMFSAFLRRSSSVNTLFLSRIPLISYMSLIMFSVFSISFFSCAGVSFRMSVKLDIS